MPRIALVMGSDSDFEILKPFLRRMKSFGIDVETRVISAHRTPREAASFADDAEARGIELIVAAAGMAAHLGGVLAAHTALPIIGIPISGKQLDGMDALLSTVMMPPGVPVATMSINGAENAAIFAAQVLSVKYPELREAVKRHKSEMAEKVLKKDEALQGSLEDI